jgi:hypothetical protein
MASIRQTFRREVRLAQRSRFRRIELKAEQREGLQLAKQSLGDYLRSWLDETAKPAISANTYRGYQDVLAHLAPIASIPLRDLAAEDLEGAFNQMIVRGSRRSLHLPRPCTTPKSWSGGP